MPPREIFLLTLALGALNSQGSPARASGEDFVKCIETSLASPPATGIVLTMVERQSQADRNGFVPGDILLSYDGQSPSSIPDLIRLVQKASEKEKIAVELLRGGEKYQVVLSPGRIGVDGIFVEKGKPSPSRPEATSFTPDFSSLSRFKEQWFLFIKDGRKTGYERHRLRRKGEGYHLDVQTVYVQEKESLEVIFRVSFQAKRGLPFDRFVFEEQSSGGKFRVELTMKDSKLVGNAGGNEVSLSAPGDLVPTYLSPLLAGTMPLEAGATAHLSLIGEGNATLYHGVALTCRGREEVVVSGLKIPGWRFEQSNFGKVSNVYWLDGERRLLRVLFRPGVEIQRSSEGEVEQELPAKILKAFVPEE